MSGFVANTNNIENVVKHIASLGDGNYLEVKQGQVKVVKTKPTGVGVTDEKLVAQMASVAQACFTFIQSSGLPEPKKRELLSQMKGGLEASKAEFLKCSQPIATIEEMIRKRLIADLKAEKENVKPVQIAKKKGPELSLDDAIKNYNSKKSAFERSTNIEKAEELEKELVLFAHEVVKAAKRELEKEEGGTSFTFTGSPAGKLYAQAKKFIANVVAAQDGKYPSANEINKSETDAKAHHKKMPSEDEIDKEAKMQIEKKLGIEKLNLNLLTAELGKLNKEADAVKYKEVEAKVSAKQKAIKDLEAQLQ